MRAWLLWGLVSVGLTGCGPSLEQLLRRASFDLECPAAELQVVEIDDKTRGVTGCGRQATYINRGTWVMNGP